jgi:hypothetical protein
VAKAEPKYSAAAFRRLLAKLYDLHRFRSKPQSTGAAAKAEASAARIEAQIKEIFDLMSPGFGEHFIRLFRNQWRSREDAGAYREQRNYILVWLGEFAAAKRKRDIVEVRQVSAVFKANRNRQMAKEFIRKKNLSTGLSDTKLMAAIGKNQDKPLGRSASIEAINRGLRALKA